MRLIQQQILLLCFFILVWQFTAHAQTDDSSMLAPSGKDDVAELQDQSPDSDTVSVESKLQKMDKVEGTRKRSNNPEKERPEPQLKKFDRRKEDR